MDLGGRMLRRLESLRGHARLQLVNHLVSIFSLEQCPFRLPIRIPSTITAEQAGFPFRALAASEGVLFPDHFDHDWRAGSARRVREAVAGLAPGVTEIHIQPAADTPELRAFAGDAADGWVADLELATGDDLREQLDSVGAVMIGFREIRDAMRAG